MSKDNDFGSRPRQAYSGSLLERAAALRGDEAKLAVLRAHERAGTYVIGGESVVLKAERAALDPLFSTAEARMLGIAAAFSPNSKYKVFWALILAGDARPS